MQNFMRTADLILKKEIRLSLSFNAMFTILISFAIRAFFSKSGLEGGLKAFQAMQTNPSYSTRQTS